ncbi:PfkB family carbohydrate kinase [Pseudonocardia nigra]|uniref:PfkB family carbohydrate kinase n=1 Tax=Pseudonocardia nigra TaxID=1921578 RepID=UPI001C5E9593|nr:PfkB family carbohydrate kinase [Pseudonocardia nigra]
MVNGTVVVLGEVLVELSSTERLVAGSQVRLGFSGDALNTAAAAAAAGARTVLVSRVPDDELGDALVEHVSSLGVDCSALVRLPGQHGAYFTHADPSGGRQFVYARRGSAASGLSPADLDPDLLRSAVVLGSGITCAISPTAAAAVRRAAELAGVFVYDPNYRPRLASLDDAAAALRAVAPHAALLTPSWPGEARALLGLTDDSEPGEAVTRLRALGARDIALTCGERGVVLAHGDAVTEIAALPAPLVVDQTGAGDSFVGTVAGRLAQGDDLPAAARLGVAAASLSVQGQGGTGFIAGLDQVRAHASVGTR